MEELERQLRNATDQKNLVLSDLFDMIAGTSVGSMIATMLALGYDVKEVKKRFTSAAENIFKGRETVLGIRRFDARPLENAMRPVVDERPLGSPDLRTAKLYT